MDGEVGIGEESSVQSVTETVDSEIVDTTTGSARREDRVGSGGLPMRRHSAVHP